MIRPLLRSWIAGLLVGCASGNVNVNAPKVDSIADRHEAFMEVVAHLKTLPAGMYDSAKLPPELQLKNLVAIHIDRRKAYALEFASTPIDSNPIFLFVESDVAYPERVARAMCRDNAGWRFDRRLEEQGWYHVHGP